MRERERQRQRQRQRHRERETECERERADRWTDGRRQTDREIETPSLTTHSKSAEICQTKNPMKRTKHERMANIVPYSRLGGNANIP